MLKCYITAIELNEGTAYVLDVAKAMHIIRTLKNKYDGLNKLINELGLCDNVEIVNMKGKKNKAKKKAAYMQTIGGCLLRYLFGKKYFRFLERMACKNQTK